MLGASVQDSESLLAGTTQKSDSNASGSSEGELSLSASEIFSQHDDNSYSGSGSDGDIENEDEASLDASELFAGSEGSADEGDSGSYSASGSYVSGEEGSYLSDEEGNNDSGEEGSHGSGEGSNVSGEEGSYVSGEESYASGEGSYVSGAGSFISGEGSQTANYSDNDSLSDGDGTLDTNKVSYVSPSTLSGSLKSPGGSDDHSILESIIEADEEEEQSTSQEGSFLGGSGSQGSIDEELGDSFDDGGTYDKDEEAYDDTHEGSFDDEGSFGDLDEGSFDDLDEGSLQDIDEEHSFDGSYSGSGSREGSMEDGSAFFPDASIDGTDNGGEAAHRNKEHLVGIAEVTDEESGHYGKDGGVDSLDTEAREEKRRKKKKRKRKRKKKQKRKNRPKVNVRSEALLDLVANVNDAMLELEEEENRSDYDEELADLDSSARRLLLGFEALLGILLQLSDELELVSTFASKKDSIAIDSLQAVLRYATELDHVFEQLKPILQTYLYEEPEEDMDDLLYRLNSLMDLLVESTHRVGERHEWNPRAETAYVTLLEMLERDTLEVTCLFDDEDVPEYALSGHLEEAWTETGHEDEFETLDVTDDIWMFRQVCYEVLVSTDQWCPDTQVLMDICGIDPADLDEDRIVPDDYEMAPVPDAAKQVLEKVHGDPLPRKAAMASILRRILPPRAITDTSLLDSFASIRNTIRNPRGLSATNLVAVSSVPEVFTDPDSLG